MSVRICAGKFGSRRISCPKGIRPTSDRVKEALFSALGIDFSGLKVLDLFAGSGALGIEAISRGAASCDFVDDSRSSVACIRKNLDSLGISEMCRIMESDAGSFVKKCSQKFDLIFMDPPYNKGLASLIAPELYGLIEQGGILAIEHSPREAIDIEVWKEKRYGDTMITFAKGGQE